MVTNKTAQRNVNRIFIPYPLSDSGSPLTGLIADIPGIPAAWFKTSTSCPPRCKIAKRPNNDHIHVFSKSLKKSRIPADKEISKA